VPGEPLRRDLVRGGKNRERDRKIEARSFLPQPGGGQVDGDAPQRPFELCARDAAADPFLRLLARLVGKAHNRERGHPALQVRLDLDRPSFEPDEGMSGGACEHTSTL
jgi:hypothetical protein